MSLFNTLNYHNRVCTIIKNQVAFISAFTRPCSLNGLLCKRHDGALRLATSINLPFRHTAKSDTCIQQSGVQFRYYATERYLGLTLISLLRCWKKFKCEDSAHLYGYKWYIYTTEYLVYMKIIEISSKLRHHSCNLYPVNVYDKCINTLK